MSSNDKKTQADIDWENRILCSDESCIGVIGPDGRCGECGRPYDGDFEGTSAPADTVDTPDMGAFDDEKSIHPAEGDWESRTLCSDESCIGVIGSDGRCKECGKPFSKILSE